MFLVKESEQNVFIVCLMWINSVGRSEAGKRPVAVLRRMLRKVMTEKLPLEQRSEEVREQTTWLSGGRFFPDEETKPAHYEAWHFRETIRWPRYLVCVRGRALGERSGNKVMLVMSTPLLKIRNYPLLLNLSFSFPCLLL